MTGLDTLFVVSSVI